MKKICLLMVFILVSIFKTQAQTASDTLIIRINPIPLNPDLVTNKDTVLRGWNATLSANSCPSPSTVIWLTQSATLPRTYTPVASTTGVPKVVSPTVTTTYYALCRSNKGCEGVLDSVKVNVRNPNPILITYNKAILRDSVGFCIGDSAVLNVNDALCNSTTVTWSNGSIGSSLTVKPTVAGLYNYNYTCTITSTSQVSVNSSNVAIRVYPTPNTPTLTPSVTTKYTTESATITGSNCTGTIRWSTGQSTTNGQAITVSPTVTTTYTAYCQSVYGCISPNASVTITVIAPQPAVTASAGEVCLGESIVLTGTGCTLSGTYMWSTGYEGPTLTIGGNGVPYSNNSVYWVYCRNASGMSIRKYIKVKFN